MSRTQELTPNWEFVADTVMGGVSQGALTHEAVGPKAVRLRGQVSLENNGGFIQMATDLGNGRLDARGWDGFELEVQGNGAIYDLRLRTEDLTRPWQSYRAEFTAPAAWMTLRFPFSALTAHRTEAALDLSRLRRIGVLAIGRAFEADVAVAALRLYREMAT